MVNEFFRFAADESVQIPERINFHQPRIIARDFKIRVVLQKQIRHVVQMHQPVERGRAKAVLLAQFIGEQAGGFFYVVMQMRIFRRDLGDVMIHDQPVLFVHARLEREIRHPRRALAQVALLPEIIVIRLQRNLFAVNLLRQPLEQQAGDESVEVALVGDNDFRLGQRQHGGNLAGRATRGER